MKLFSKLSMLIMMVAISCQSPQTKKSEIMGTISETIISSVTKMLLDEFGQEETFRIERGVKQVALFWKEQDGTEDDFINFCMDYFIKTGEELDVLYKKLERNYEILYGHFNKMNVALMEPLHLNTGPITSIDMMFGSYQSSAHLEEDFFNNKIAFKVLLNFPRYSLDEKNKLGVEWTDKNWSFARLGDLYTSRIPASLALELSIIMTDADTYISEYNIHLGKLRDENNERLFPEDLKLISHWGLRDELKAQYAQSKENLQKQLMIYQVMKRIINQEIPEKVINSDEHTWNLFDNTVRKDGKSIDFKPEPDTRYEHIRKSFVALKNIDNYYPYYSTYIDLKFEDDMQIPQQEVEKLFVEFVSSDEIRKIGKIIAERLNRPLEPFDIWYDGFKSRSNISEDVLDKLVQTKFTTVEAFEKEIPVILSKLNFPKDATSFISSKIRVDDSRGAGHAWGAAMKEDKALLRTRAGDSGMNYKGFNIAMHELGHNVEQTISLHDVYSYFINGVPNTAFSEALAFMFQKRDMKILDKEDKNSQNLEILDLAWSLYEIMGVSLVDMNLWKWLYENPHSTKTEIKEATLRISKDIWNKYYAALFGVQDQEILAVYSHMTSNPLYLSAYPLGHLIEFQLEESIKGKIFGEEVLKIFSTGNITPDVWMIKNTGQKLSNEFILKKIRNIIESPLKSQN